MKLKLFAWAVLIALPGLSAAQTFQNLTAVSGTQNPGLYSTGAAWGDYDGDGDLDLYVTNWGTAVTVPANALYENGGDGSFLDVAADRGVANKGNSLAPAWADYDNDGDLDLYVGDFFDQDFLYANQDGAFTEVGRSRKTINLVRQGSVTAVAWADYDNDGFLDLYLGKLFYDNELYHNSGDGTFLQVLDLGLGDRRDTQGVVWVDYDNDGDLDLYLSNREQENALYRNDLSERGSFADVGHATGLDDKEIG
ncbi:MAG: VCBS repeat-containing protein, partial [Gemmatimonadetes bacterium]|nr:VCBS repeat-containing protein [Gemmatimonadota bacterium]